MTNDTTYFCIPHLVKFDCVSASDACRDPEWKPLGYSCYRVEGSIKGDYEEANLSCSQRGAHLATFEKGGEPQLNFPGIRDL